MEEESYLVFVYGTLKRNEPNHHYMIDSTFVTEATSVDKLPLVIASKYNIPFALNKPGVGHNLKGEIYRINNKTLAALDILENHPTLYVREIRSFQTEDGSTIEAWIYLLKQYKQEMLELEMYDCYKSNGSHGKKYVASDDDLEKPEEILEIAKN